MDFRALTDKFRKFCAKHGYSCDLCGREVFSYPQERLCPACEEEILKNDGLRCPVCGRKTVAEGVCLTCKASRPTFDLGVSPFVYDELAASAINRLKNGRRHLSFFFAERMVKAFVVAMGGSFDRENTVIACVPMTETARIKRGYNQAEELAKGVADLLGVPFRESLLVKTRETGSQKKMSARERAENVAGAFRVHERRECRDKTVVLIDDIMTTGSTGSELARLMKGAGAKKIVFLTATSLPEKK